MKNLVIIGAGGMGKEVFYTAKHSIGYGTEFDIKGFVDDNIHSLDGFYGYPPVLNTIHDYQPEPNDVFTCSIGDVHTKRKLCELIKSKGGKFQTLIHKDCQLRENVKIGEGTIVDCFAIIGSCAVVGENCLIQAYAVVGHDCIVGDYSRLDVRTLLVGGIKTGENVTIHTNAIISHNVELGNDSTVAALSLVIRSVKAGTTVMGNPAKRLEF
jgi:sugar O-acyltransferase (sialic acid O-acetyltransferase NeuD family)